jgi:hypothetical protein
MLDSNEITDIRLHPRPMENVTLAIPVDTLELLRTVANRRDMSIEALLKFYVGQALRGEPEAQAPSSVPSVPSV